jgi:transposase
MTKALSMDLRSRVLGAIRDGMSCRQAAAHFGVSASSAIRWHERERTQGHAVPKPQGGDRRSGRIEAYAATILDLVGVKPDMTLSEIQTALIEKGASFGIATLWRFFDRRRITFKKRPPTQPSKTAPTSWRGDGGGSRRSRISNPGVSSSSMRPGPRRP